MKEYIIPDDFLEYSNDNKFVAEISQESINDLFACVLDNIRTINTKNLRRKKMNKLGETNCRDCYYATKINTDTYRCRRKKYDIEKKTCFVPRKENVDGERKDGAEMEGKEDAMP